MLNETFYLDGIDARSAGIQLQAPIEFSEAVPVVEAQTIPGRNGDLIWETGSYENKDGQRLYTVEVVADELEFAESKAASQKAGNGQNENTGQQSYGDGFEPLGDDEGLPFT